MKEKPLNSSPSVHTVASASPDCYNCTRSRKQHRREVTPTEKLGLKSWRRWREGSTLTESESRWSTDQDGGVTSELSWEGEREGGGMPRSSLSKMKECSAWYEPSQTLWRTWSTNPPPATTHSSLKHISDNRWSAQVKHHLAFQSALHCNSSREVDFKVTASLQPDRFPAHTAKSRMSRRHRW